MRLTDNMVHAGMIGTMLLGFALSVLVGYRVAEHKSVDAIQTYQEQLADSEHRVKTLQRLLDDKADTANKLCESLFRQEDLKLSPWIVLRYRDKDQQTKIVEAHKNAAIRYNSSQWLTEWADLQNSAYATGDTNESDKDRHGTARSLLRRNGVIQAVQN